jgi:ABC-2 type transport system ATP-binding protein
MTDLPRRSDADGGPAVAVHGLTKIFPVPFHPTRRVVAVKDLNLRIEPGEVYGLLGPNGSGKSTTLKIILGLVSPTRGRTEIFGRDSRLVESRQAVGFLPENPYFYKFLTGAETLRFFGRLCGMRGATLKSRVNELLDLVGLNKARDRRLGTYSKGMLQRSAAESPCCSRRICWRKRRKFATASAFSPMACWFVKALCRN